MAETVFRLNVSNLVKLSFLPFFQKNLENDQNEQELEAEIADEDDGDGDDNNEDGYKEPESEEEDGHLATDHGGGDDDSEYGFSLIENVSLSLESKRERPLFCDLQKIY